MPYGRATQAGTRLGMSSEGLCLETPHSRIIGLCLCADTVKLA